MISHNQTVRVRYGETDKMGYVYYGNYALYYEIGRNELMRTLDFPYSKIEEMGVMLAISQMNCKYFKPAHYDDNLTIKSYVKSKPSVKIRFEHEIYNQNNELLNRGYTDLVFIDKVKKLPVRPPKTLSDLFDNYF
jgi:acyl-CoA thioester hydrolase